MRKVLGSAPRSLQVICILLCGFLWSGSLLAFKPGIHEEATEEVLTNNGFDVDSADEVGDSNYFTDTFELLSDAAHADNNRLDLASSRLKAKIQTIGDALAMCKRRDALDAFGEALHTVQDIYSHSNSIDNGIPIGNLLELRRGTAPCSLPNFAPGGLVTGYFNIFSPPNYCLGAGAGECCHEDLNKDNGDPDDTPNHANHAAALAAAKDATKTYLGFVEEDIRDRFPGEAGEQLIRFFKERQRTRIFVIDDTGSMGEDIAGVKASVNTQLDELIAQGEAPTLGLITFKDTVSNRGLTCDVEELRNQINSLFANGGGGCPEASNLAMLEALSEFPLIPTDMQKRGGRISIATDASALNPLLGPLVAARAAALGVSIDVILTGDCFDEVGATTDERLASSNDPSAVAAMRKVAKNDDPLSSISARTQLRALAAATGGAFFNVDRIEVEEVVPTLLELGDPDVALLASRRIDLTSSGGNADFEIPVDDQLSEQVTFMISASGEDALPALAMKRPSGELVEATDPDVSLQVLSSVITVSIASPAAGPWQLELTGVGTFVLRAFGKTPFRLNSLRLQEEPAPTALRRPEVDLIPIQGQPVAGSDVVGDLRFTIEPQNLRALLLRPDGTLIEELLASQELSRRYRVEFTIPNEPFVVEARGNTPAGSPFVRQIEVPVSPQTVGLTVSPGLIDVPPGTTAQFDVAVHNSSTAEATYQLSASNTLGWPMSTLPNLTILPGESATAVLTVAVPGDAPTSQRNELAVLVEQIDAVQVRNSAMVTVVVTDTETCVSSSTNLCLNGGRFHVEVEWTNADGDSGLGEVAPLSSDDSGVFYFFDPNNWEMLLKVLDGCSINDRYWVFSAATTDVAYTLRVTDTQTGTVKEYTNPISTAAPAITDIDAFATCP